MISLDKLMNLSEAATGFKGGSIVDELPGLSLTEATAGLPVVILESQIELNESVMAQNEALVESVIVGLQSGTQADVDSLTEGAFETLVNKIKAFFEKLRKWVNSIIAKLTVQIDKMRLSGTQMLAKYKDSKMLNHSFEDLTVNGYKFEKKDPFTAADICDAIDDKATDLLIHSLVCTQNGVLEMSAEIDGLVETSLNLGILKTEEENVFLQYALRSNKQSALDFLEQRLKAFYSAFNVVIKTGGHYPPWEFNNNSVMQKLYIEAYKEKFGEEPQVVAIHAGLECGILSSKINGLDCIAIGPLLNDVHTINEKLDVKSAEEIYELVINLLKKCK